MLVKPAGGRYYVDNYYIRGDRDETFDLLLGRITADGDFGGELTALVHKRHSEAFRRNGFNTYLEFKNYDKMDYDMRRGHGQAAEHV